MRTVDVSTGVGNHAQLSIVDGLCRGLLLPKGQEVMSRGTMQTAVHGELPVCVVFDGLHSTVVVPTADGGLIAAPMISDFDVRYDHRFSTERMPSERDWWGTARDDNGRALHPVHRMRRVNIGHDAFCYPGYRVVGFSGSAATAVARCEEQEDRKSLADMVPAGFNADERYGADR